MVGWRGRAAQDVSQCPLSEFEGPVPSCCAHLGRGHHFFGFGPLRRLGGRVVVIRATVRSAVLLPNGRRQPGAGEWHVDVHGVGLLSRRGCRTDVDVGCETQNTRCRAMRDSTLPKAARTNGARAAGIAVVL